MSDTSPHMSEESDDIVLKASEDGSVIHESKRRKTIDNRSNNQLRMTCIEQNNYTQFEHVDVKQAVDVKYEPEGNFREHMPQYSAVFLPPPILKDEEDNKYSVIQDPGQVLQVNIPPENVGIFVEAEAHANAVQVFNTGMNTQQYYIINDSIVDGNSILILNQNMSESQVIVNVTDTQCNTCNLKCSSHEELLVHINNCVQNRNSLENNMKISEVITPSVVNESDQSCSSNQELNLLLKCSVCKMNLYSHDEYNDHAKLHAGKRESAVNKCKTCCVTLPNDKLQVLIHFNTHVADLNKKPWQCKKCNKCTFESMTHLMEHISFHDNIPCLYCKLWFNDYKELHLHLKKDHIVCVYCNIRFKSFESYIKHENEHKEFMIYNYKCTLCPKTFTCQKFFTCHLSSVHPNFNYSVRHMKDARQYMLLESPRSEAELNLIGMDQCIYCFGIFKFDDLLIHLIMKHNIYKCGWCTSYVSAKNPDFNKCHFCGTSNKVIFKDSSKKIFYPKLSERALGYECYLCNAFFVSYSTHSAHVRLCEKNKVYIEEDEGVRKPVHKDHLLKCCSKLLNSQIEFKEHLKAHKALDFTLPCCFCDEMLHRQNLFSHLKSKHNYCPKCSVAFNNSVDLWNHEMLHTDAETLIFECPCCKLCSDDKDIFVKHLREKHHIVMQNVSSMAKKIVSAPVISVSDDQLLNIKPYRIQCSYCNKFFPLLEFNYFLNHLCNSHKIYFCELCNQYSLKPDCLCKNAKIAEISKDLDIEIDGSSPTSEWVLPML